MYQHQYFASWRMDKTYRELNPSVDIVHYISPLANTEPLEMYLGSSGPSYPIEGVWGTLQSMKWSYTDML